MSTLPNLGEIEAAAAVVYREFPPTPQYRWALLSERLGTDCWVKHENHTPVGAFKIRGGALRVPSFHADLVSGVATYWWEFLKAVPQLDVAYVPIGLGSGACAAIAAKLALGHKARIVGVVSRHATTYADSLAAGRVVEAPVTTQIADGMAVRRADAAALQGRSNLRGQCVGIALTGANVDASVFAEVLGR